MEVDHDATRRSEVQGMFMVVDTNCFISYLPWLSCLSRAALHRKIRVVVPWIVACELDSLKQRPRTNDGAFEIGAAARAAIRFLFNAFKHGQLVGQTALEDSQVVDRHQTTLTNDDRIMHCCLQLIHNPSCQKVLLLSDDKSLGVKCMMNGIEAFTFSNVPAYLRDLALYGFQETDSMDIDFIDGSDPVGWLPVQSWFHGNSYSLNAGQAHLVASAIESIRNDADNNKNAGDGRAKAEGHSRVEEVFRRFEWLRKQRRADLPQASDEVWRILREVCEKAVPVVENVLKQQHGDAWLTVVNCPQPWEEGDVLHILRVCWRRDFQGSHGNLHNEVAALQDVLRKLRKKVALTVEESLIACFALWMLVRCFALQDKRKTVLWSSKYLLECARHLDSNGGHLPLTEDIDAILPLVLPELDEATPGALSPSTTNGDHMMLE
uniref:PIN domain-containing protein n=1 Tax=Hanusia phi TaxID=3032 RepID=A0A7S0HCZ9_9CRYP|mmetsp:Transcript_1341/g.2925  ORF Transcript_1341/g.2925 Transcript_1341/m.2925 type:complete len:436 (+) Transcript_1341:73-1380(+)